MKTLTKILTVVALIVLCVSLFTLTVYAETQYTVTVVYEARAASCSVEGREAGFKLNDGRYYKGEAVKGEKYTQEDLDASFTPIASVDELSLGKDPHSPGEKQTIDSTCSKNGVEYYECENCHKHFKDEDCLQPGEKTLPLEDHVSGGHVDEKEATCSEDGHVAYDICANCGKKYDPDTGNEIKNTVIPATGDHSWSAWVVIKDPTNVSPGQQKRICEDCGEIEYQEIPATGIIDGEDIDYVIAIRDTWLRGEEALTFESPLVKRLNDASGPNANFVGVRIGTDSLYENSYDTFDFWSWDKYVKLGDKTMQGLREGTYRLWIYDKRHPEVYTNSCVFYVVDVPTLEPYSTDKHVVNSTKSLRFIASEEIDPNSVMVGSKKLYDPSDYFVSNDRQNITLSAEFLNNRQTGTYTISAVTTGGRTVKTNFYILTTAQASSSPRTGDESQIGLWAAFLLLSGAAVVVLVPKLRKQGVK